MHCGLLQSLDSFPVDYFKRLEQQGLVQQRMQLVDRHTCKGGSAKVAQLIDNFPILCENVHCVWGVACFPTVELCPEAVVKVSHHKPAQCFTLSSRSSHQVSPLYEILGWSTGSDV